jgi:hypothetical protein
MSSCIRTAVGWLALVAVFTTGCVSKHIETEQAADIRRVAVATYLESNEVLVYDRTGKQVGTEAEVAAGLLGGVIGGAIAGAVEGSLTWKAMQESFGGDPALLTKALGDQPLAPIIDRGVTAGLGTLPVLGPLDLERLGAADAPARRTSDGVPVHDYRPLMDRWDIDTVIEMRLNHGLAAYAAAPARPMVIGEVFVIDVVEDRVIMRSPLSSEHAYPSAHHVPELAADGAALYRQEIEAASRAFGGLVLNEFAAVSRPTGAATSLSAGSNAAEPAAVALDAAGEPRFRDAITLWDLSCSHPVELERDCSSWSGAKREIELDGVPMKLAGSADGRHVLVLRLTNSAAATGRLDEESRQAYLAIAKALRQRGVGIVAVTPIETSGKRVGYLLELDRNGYDVLSAPSVPVVSE